MRPRTGSALTSPRFYPVEVTPVNVEEVLRMKIDPSADMIYSLELQIRMAFIIVACRLPLKSVGNLSTDLDGKLFFSILGVLCV